MMSKKRIMKLCANCLEYTGIGRKKDECQGGASTVSGIPETDDPILSFFWRHAFTL